MWWFKSLVNHSEQLQFLVIGKLRFWLRQQLESGRLGIKNKLTLSAWQWQQLYTLSKKSSIPYSSFASLLKAEKNGRKRNPMNTIHHLSCGVQEQHSKINWYSFVLRQGNNFCLCSAQSTVLHVVPFKIFPSD